MRFIRNFVGKFDKMDALSVIKKPIEDELEEFGRRFSGAVRSSTPLLNEVWAYIRQRTGKMMRPMLTLLTAKLCGGVTHETYCAAISLELLHTASLVHDDVVDESDERRGQASVNAVYNNKVSVLVGDFLLATSLKFAASVSARGVNIVCALGQQLSEGELIQLQNTSASHFSEESYFEVIDKKTAALFAACAEAGAVSAGATEVQVDVSRRFGETVGMIFQIKDDLFDYFPSDEVGKPWGNDMREGKLTLPALYVLNHVADEKMRRIALRVRSLQASEEEIASLIAFVKDNGGVDYAVQKMQELREVALRYLPVNAPAGVCEALTAYVDYVIGRVK